MEIFDELQPDVICEDNVPCFPAIPASGRPWVRIVSCNPLELKDPDLPPTFSGYPVGGPERLGRVPRRVPPHARRDARVVRRVRAGARRAAAARPASSSTSRRGSTSTSTRPRPTTRARSRSAPTWHRLETSVRGTDEAFELPDELARRRRRLVYLSLGSLGSADVDLMKRLVDVARRVAAPLHRLQGPAGRPVRAGRQHVGRGVPAAAVDPAAGRPRHHARRQQHDHRVLPLRQADDRAAAVLGPVRQRAARRRDRLRGAAADLRLRPRRAAPARSTGCSHDTALHSRMAPIARGCRRTRARSGRPTWSNGSRRRASR